MGPSARLRGGEPSGAPGEGVPGVEGVAGVLIGASGAGCDGSGDAFPDAARTAPVDYDYSAPQDVNI
ncbi:hypothetical protein GCM10010498_52370 [Streptomyces cavourensis]|nr:hypothetical protein GCM10010498_52370 [Streptomyces cavourensis]